MNGREDQGALARLSEAEVQVLGLLAEGHTVKSIAQVTGRSPAWINERLRDARGKTGAASSRELARLLRDAGPRTEPKKIGPKKIDLADAAPAPLAAPARWWRRHPRVTIGGGLIMIALLIAALALAGAQPAQDAPAATPSSDGSVAARQHYLVSLTLDQAGRSAQPVRLLVAEREMVRYSVDDRVEANVVVMPTAGRSDRVDVALSFQLTDNTDPQVHSRRAVTSTVTIDKGGHARLPLPTRGGQAGGTLDIGVAPAAAPERR